MCGEGGEGGIEGGRKEGREGVREGGREKLSIILLIGYMK